MRSYNLPQYRLALSTILVFVYFTLEFIIIISLTKTIVSSHIDGSIYWISSDGPVYLAILYELQYSNDFIPNKYIYLNQMPVVLLDALQYPELYFLFTLTLSAVSLHTFKNLFKGNLKSSAIVITLLFPYFLLGPFSINKEIFAICSAIFVVAYYIKGNNKYIVLSLLLAFLARSYMVISILLTFAALPRNGNVRWPIVISSLAFLSLLPLLRYEDSIISWGLNEHIREGSGRFATIFSELTRQGLYWLVYPFKYLLLILSKSWSLFVVDFDLAYRKQNLMEGIVSIHALFLFALSFRLFLRKKNLQKPELFYAAFISPIPLMFTDIFHWRYSSFVVVFLIAFILINIEKLKR